MIESAAGLTDAAHSSRILGNQIRKLFQTLQSLVAREEAGIEVMASHKSLEKRTSRVLRTRKLGQTF
jgi:hypothetical protein